MYTLKVIDTFSAAHRLRGYEGKCEGLHGHNWKVEAEASFSKLNRIGISMDFKRFKKALSEALADYDHKDLNDIPEFKAQNPSAEHLARNVHKKLVPLLRGTGARRLRVSVWESETSCCSYGAR